MSKLAQKSPRYEQEARKTAAEQQRIQAQIARADKRHPKEENEHAMQAGARKYPAPPFDGQHLEKPGIQADLKLAPMCDAP